MKTSKIQNANKRTEQQHQKRVQNIFSQKINKTNQPCTKK